MGKWSIDDLHNAFVEEVASAEKDLERAEMYSQTYSVPVAKVQVKQASRSLAILNRFINE